MIENYNPIVKKNNVLAPLWDNAFIHKNASTGAVASFQDGVGDVPIREMSAEINPVQDLHGYDYPWAAGGGVNKINAPDTTLTGGGYIYNGALVIPAGTYTINFVWSGTGTPSATVALLDADGNSLTSGSHNIPWTFTTTATSASLKLYVSAAGTYSKIQINEGSSALPYAPYSNICPIYGYDEANVTTTSKNIFDEATLLQATGWTESNGVYSGLNNALHIAFFKTKGGLPNLKFKANTRYTISFKFRSTNENKITVIAFLYTDGTSNDFYLRGTAETTYTFTSTANKTVMMIFMSYGSSDTVYISNMQVEEGETATNYERFIGNTYHITFPSEVGTAYSGTLSVNADGTGTLVVDKQYLDLSSISNGWAIYPGIKGYTLLIPTMASKTKAIASSHFKTIASADANATAIATNVNHYVYFCGATKYGDTIANFKQWISDNNVEFVIELDSPITYTIPANQIECITFLSGLNNVWINTGDITNLVYYSDAQTLNEETEMLKKYVSANTITDTASGSIATFPDGAADIPLKSLEVGINPVQDLHGYDNPWPDGGGKNLITYPYVTTGSTWNGMAVTESGGKVTIKGTQSGVSPFMFADGVTVKGGVTYTINPNVTGTGGIFCTIYDFNTSTVLANTSRNPATFTPTEDHTVRIYLNPSSSAQGASFDFSVQPQLEVGSSATEWTPYSNICPISGYTSANVTRTGVNIWDEEIEIGSLDTITGKNNPVANQIRTKNFVSVVGGETYRMITTTDPNGVWMFFYDSNKNLITDGLPSIGSISNNARRAPNDARITMPLNCSYVRFYFQQAYGTTYNNDTGINYPSTDTSYHKGAVETYSIFFQSSAGTVYGGTLTVNKDGSGILSVTKGFRVFYGDSSEAWKRQSTFGYFYIDTTFDNQYKSSSEANFALSNKYVQVPYSNITYMANNKFCIGYVNSYYRLAVKDERFSTVSQFTEELATNNLEICYKYAEPVIIPLTEEETSIITSLYGTNNVWSDTNGDVSLEYVANAKLYIAKKISEALS